MQAEREQPCETAWTSNLTNHAAKRLTEWRLVQDLTEKSEMSQDTEHLPNILFRSSSVHCAVWVGNKILAVAVISN